MKTFRTKQVKKTKRQLYVIELLNGEKVYKYLINPNNKKEIDNFKTIKPFKGLHVENTHNTINEFQGENIIFKESY